MDFIKTKCKQREVNHIAIYFAIVVLIRQYLKERGICDKIYQYITVLSEIKLPHNSSPHDL